MDTFFDNYASHPNYKAPTGNTLHAKSWQTESVIRLLLNNLDKEVSEKPEELIVYGGIGKAARNKESLHKILQALLVLEEDESLLIQSGKPVAVFKTHTQAPRVLIANSNLVPNWANWDHFHELEKKGLMMYGQMTAGSWIYIGSQGIVQGTYETFAELARRSFKGSLKGTLTVSGGLGGMGGAQPLAVTLNEGVFLGVDMDPERIQKRLDSKYIDTMTDSYEEAKTLILQAKGEKRAFSCGLVGNIVDILHRLEKDQIKPEILTDQTSAHDPLFGYIPENLSLKQAESLRAKEPKNYEKRSKESMKHHIEALLRFLDKGSIVFDYGNNLRGYAKEAGALNAFSIPGFVPEYIRPLFCEGKGPFRFVALSGDPEDIYTTDKALMELFPDNQGLIRWLKAAQKKISFQGLPSRICWLGLGERKKAALLFNKLVQEKKVKAPIIIGRDHLDTGSVASPNRETEKMLDGSDAVSDWPLLNLMSNTASGATWVSFHHGGGVGMGFSQHAGMVILADGSKRANDCLERVLHNDPAIGVIRHADAGYDMALSCQEKHQLKTYTTFGNSLG